MKWNKFSLVLLLVLFGSVWQLSGQTCTITGSSPLNWVNPGPACSGGGNASGKTILIVPAGFVLNFDSNDDTWTGTQIEVYGTINVTANPIFNCSFIVRDDGIINLSGKLSLGTGSNCGYNLAVQSGGTVNVGGTGSDRLSICGVDIMKGNGACNSCGGTNSGKCAYNGNPYCEPAAGFTGPTGYGQNGYDATLPITLAYFNAELVDDQVELNWATDKEESFDHFEIEHASSNVQFSFLTEVEGAGYNTQSFQKYSWVHTSPVIGDNYYRLKAVDINGSFEYFNIRQVSVSASKEFSIYPNPSGDGRVSYKLNFEPTPDARIIITNSFGQELKGIQVTAVEDELTLSDPLKPGVYYVRYASNKFTRAMRLMVR